MKIAPNQQRQCKLRNPIRIVSTKDGDPRPRICLRERRVRGGSSSPGTPVSTGRPAGERDSFGGAVRAGLRQSACPNLPNLALDCYFVDLKIPICCWLGDVVHCPLKF